MLKITCKRAELEDNSAWEINEVTRTRGSDKNCFQESQDNYINEKVCFAT